MKFWPNVMVVAHSLLPPTARWDLRILLCVLGAIPIFFGMGVLALGISEFLDTPSLLINVVVFLLFTYFGYSIVKMKRWARLLVVIGLWLIIVFTLSALGPFADMDRSAAGLVRASVPEKWVILIKIVVPALYVIHVLGKYKSDFGPKTPPVT